MVYLLYMGCLIFINIFLKAHKADYLIYINYMLAATSQLYIYCLGGTKITDSVRIIFYL